MRRFNIVSVTSTTADSQVPDPTKNKLPVPKFGCAYETTEKKLPKNASSPSAISSSISSIKSKQAASVSENYVEKKITKRPPLAVKKISLLSDSISKFEQKSAEIKPKVTWKSFLKQSPPSKDNVIYSSTESIEQVYDVKNPDANNNDIKLQTRVKISPQKITEEIISTSNNQKSLTKPETTINNPDGSINNSTKEKTKATKIDAQLKTEIDLTSTGVDVLPLKTFQQNVEIQNARDNLTYNRRSTTSDCTIKLEKKGPFGEEYPCATTSNPPLKVKKVVRRVVKKIVTKSSSNLAVHDATSEAKKNKIEKKKVTKTEPENISSTDKKVTDRKMSTTITQLNGKYETTNMESSIKEIEKSKCLLDINNTSDSGSMVSNKKSVSGDLMLEKSTFDKNPNTPKSSQIQLDYDVNCLPLLKLPDMHVFSDISENENNKPYTRSMVPARSKTIDLGVAIEVLDKLSSTSLSPRSCETEALMESATLKKRSHSWGKADKLPLLRDNTMSDMYSAGSSSSSYDSRQSSRSVTPHHMFPRSKDEMHLHSDYSLPNCRSLSLRHRASSVCSEKSNYLSSKIEDFLKRTDHAMQEWTKIGKKIKEVDILDDLCGTYRSKSVSKIMSRGLQLLKDQPSLSRSSSRLSSVSQDTFDDCFDDDDNQTIVDDAEVIV